MTLYGARHHGCRVNEYTWNGMRLVVMENERLRVSVLPDKGADIVEFRYKQADVDVLWHAPQRIPAPGSYIPTVARAGGSFLDYYGGGWQEVFPSAGPPTVYKGAELGQHGEVALLPWDARVIEDSAARIEVDFSVETVRTPFRLDRRMILERGQARLRLEERVTNLGTVEMAYAWGHHPTFGPPFLTAGCRIETAAKRISVPEAVAGMATRRLAAGESAFPLAAGTHGGNERVDTVLGPEAVSEDVIVLQDFSEGWCALRNPQHSLAVTMAWDARVFPFLWSWQVYGGSLEYPYFGRAYTLGLEPFSCPLEALASLVARGAAPLLRAGELIETAFEMGIVEAKSEVTGVSLGGDCRFLA
jgi:galactose mutarotase-like enzyme